MLGGVVACESIVDKGLLSKARGPILVTFDGSVRLAIKLFVKESSPIVVILDGKLRLAIELP